MLSVVQTSTRLLPKLLTQSQRSLQLVIKTVDEISRQNSKKALISVIQERLKQAEPLDAQSYRDTLRAIVMKKLIDVCVKNKKDTEASAKS